MASDAIMSDAYREAWRWASDHFGELRERYGDLWVAVDDGRVVASGPSPRRVEAEASRTTGRSAEDIYVEYIESGAAVYGQGLT